MKGSNGRTVGGEMGDNDYREIVAGMRRTIAAQSVRAERGERGARRRILGRILVIAALVVGGLLVAKAEPTAVAQSGRVEAQHEAQ